MDVERIRQKVEAGERLSDDELTALQKAAQNVGGPALRTAVAQALINADQATQALPLLEAVRRDFPKDLQVHLALGRALISLERWTDAKAPLRQALWLNPHDPEVLKAMAVLAMRQGEWERARSFVEDVLAQDPFDGEAQQLSEELAQTEAASLTERPALAEFTTALVGALRERSIPHLIQREQIMLRVGRGGIARLDLQALYEDFLEGGKPLAVSVESVARELAERTLGVTQGKLPLLARVLPVVRDSTFLERGLGAARREGPAGLWIFYAIDDPELVRYVPEGLLDVWHIGLEQLEEAAWKNLEARPTEVRALELEQGALRLSSTPTGLWALAHGDGHDTARLLTPSHQAALEKSAGPGPYRVYLGLRELVLVAREDDPVAVEKISGLDAGRDGIPGAWRLHEGRLTQLPDWPE